jgi:SAM-dependent methyltransferase
MDELFYEIYNDLPRQGPGNAQCTRRAYDSLPDPSAVRRILDIGCGAGMQTLDLARFSSAEIVAVDNNPVVIDVLARRVQREGLSSRVRPLVADMFGLDASLERFDLVWSEGAIYIIGLERGLKQWRRLIKPSGCLAFTELSWLVPNPPAEAAAFWAREYPAMNSIEGNLDIIAASGYRLRNHFTLPEAAWWVDFYDPLEQTLEKMRVKYASAEGAIALLDANQAEIDLYRRHSHSYGYVFYVIQALP